jgi:hypothetical protein
MVRKKRLQKNNPNSTNINISQFSLSWNTVLVESSFSYSDLLFIAAGFIRKKLAKRGMSFAVRP